MTALLAATGLAIAGRLEPSDVSVPAGQLVALVGPNGGGKTSLLRALAGVEEASGSVLVDGQSIDSLHEARRARLLAFVTASRDIGWPVSVRDLIGLGFVGAVDHSRVDELLDQLELGPLAHRPVTTLSTGERARVLIARALAARPRLLLLDEPLSNLDPYWVLRLMEIFRAAAIDGTAVLVALHDLAQLNRFDRALLIAAGQVQMDETPAHLTASERFETIFRITSGEAGWTIRPAGRQSSR